MEHPIDSGPANVRREAVSLHVISGRAAAFLATYLFGETVMLLCAVVCVGAVILFAAALAHKVLPSDILPVLGRILTFDFTVFGESPAQVQALSAAVGLSAGIVGVVAAVLFMLFIRWFIARKVTTRAVEALLPGWDRGFVLSDEGVYYLYNRNRITQTAYYALFPWDKLSVAAWEERKNRVVLQAGRYMIPLKIPRREVPFGDLQSVLLERLPEGGRLPSARGIRFRWGRAAVALALIAAAWMPLVRWMDQSIVPGAGAEYCDVRGDIHYSFETAFESQIYYFELPDLQDQTAHRFCELHGVVYITLHPGLYFPAVLSMIRQCRLGESAYYPWMTLEIAFFPALAWFCLGLLTVAVGQRPRYKTRWM